MGIIEAGKRALLALTGSIYGWFFQSGVQMATRGGWTDVTKFLNDACATLNVGEMVHGENFSLYEAMTAVEVGCAKMDIGESAEDDAGGCPLPVQEAKSLRCAKCISRHKSLSRPLSWSLF